MADDVVFSDAKDFPPITYPDGKNILSGSGQSFYLTFLDLLDTINSYSGYGGRFLMVKLTEDGVTVGPEVIESDKRYTHTQSVASNEWTIAHNLGKNPSIQIVDDNDRIIVGEVEHVDDDNAVVRFEFPLTGKVYLN